MLSCCAVWSSWVVFNPVLSSTGTVNPNTVNGTLLLYQILTIPADEASTTVKNSSCVNAIY